MKVRFLKNWGSFKSGSVHLVNDNFGRKAIGANIVELADTAAAITETPLPQGKGADTEEAKKKPTSKRKPKGDTRSK